MNDQSINQRMDSGDEGMWDFDMRADDPYYEVPLYLDEGSVHTVDEYRSVIQTP